MSHRPLDVIKQEYRAAHRAPHLSARYNGPSTDVIDSLDTIGGAYHHDGPYDAASAARNRHKKYSPLDAVHDSNMEAIRATPREYMQDCLTKHVPFQGTATIPAGFPDMRGHRMDYVEGADLMREPDAAGGAYRRWPGIQYHPDDLKGKGEPSFTIERVLKEKIRQAHRAGGMGGANDFEMQSGVNHYYVKGGASTRQRSVSNTDDGRPGPSGPDVYSLSPPDGGFSNSTKIRRRNTTGRRIGEGIKRRLGHLRPKKDADY
ncbi:hypothetical protein SODALDRAFT_323270 [Sodiomyces alkalinus F11]|uniref:Pal1-domain-containing protein n=1 Tax=Sodiomyces alkalinus (strain CBS 110278 / VKM F-3762 / F11) TaxID=1314773 RepID=A0A3N2PZR7_SODAK|nr:hypothetical protein SODALDRAFT_323270 [Sodiomyces alkalinus F11]ROT39982.1 hypothetical protein SODALDRAFT_323270 [Sodiomyces alkalinus F11]